MWSYTLLPKILNMSLTAGIVTVLVLFTRILLKRVPKIFSYALWAVVLFRLVCPVSFSSEFSLLGVFRVPAATNGSIAYIPEDIVHTEYPQVDLPLSGISKVINNNSPQGGEQTVADPLEWQMAAATLLWLCGMAAMLAYSAVSLLSMHQRLIGAVRLCENIYLADRIATPFVIGVIRPRIYLPSALTEQEQSYIILHEQTHIRRLDHVFKMIAFLALAVHWFNPLVWVAFMCCVKDMEMSCDERVLKEMGSGVKEAYSTSLLYLAAGRRLINGSPLAFGEGNIKGRIKNVMNFKKPAFWVLIVTMAAVIITAACLLTNPPKTKGTLGAYSSSTVFAMASAYAFDECLYMNPLSSYYPAGTTGQFYLFDPDGVFTIISEETKEVQERISPIEWTGKEVDPREWDALFDIGKPVDIGTYSVRRQFEAADKYRIYQMDEEVWLATIREGNMWSLYRLKQTAGPDFASNPAATVLEPASPKLSPEQEVGVDMAVLDYASDDIVIFHDYFGLFVFDLDSKKIIRSLDLNPIGCTATQGDDYCEVTVGTDGNTVLLHPMSSKNMYVYTVADNTLQEKVYKRMEDRFADFVDIADVIDYQKAGSYSHSAVKFDTGEFGYLHTSDWTVGTLTYIRGGDMLYRLFGFDELSSSSALPSPAAGSEIESAASVKFFVITTPARYTPAMSSTPGLRLDITYDGPKAQILYEAETGSFITWQDSVVEELGNRVTRQSDASALYWRPNSDSPKDDVITLTVRNEAGGKIAGRALTVTKDVDGYFTAIVEPWELISRAFAEAFFEKNTKIMKSYLLDPDKGFHEYNLGNGLSDAKTMKLKFNPNDIKSDSVSAQYEFRFDGDESFTYLQLSLKKVNDVWKIESYGLEK